MLNKVLIGSFLTLISSLGFGLELDIETDCTSGYTSRGAETKYCTLKAYTDQNDEYVLAREEHGKLKALTFSFLADMHHVFKGMEGRYKGASIWSSPDVIKLRGVRGNFPQKGYYYTRIFFSADNIAFDEYFRFIGTNAANNASQVPVLANGHYDIDRELEDVMGEVGQSEGGIALILQYVHGTGFVSTIQNDPTIGLYRVDRLDRY